MFNINTQHTITYSQPQKLIKVLKTQQEQKNLFEKNSKFDKLITKIKTNEELSNIEIIKELPKGSSALVFETADGNILKITKDNHFPQNRPHENFDVPIFKKGKIGGLYYYIEEKLYQHGLSEEFTRIIKDKIVEAGYKPFDIWDSDINQIGFSKDGKLYLLDPECARFKTPIHAFFKKLKNFLKNIN